MREAPPPVKTIAGAYPSTSITSFACSIAPTTALSAPKATAPPVFCANIVMSFTLRAERRLVSGMSLVLSARACAITLTPGMIWPPRCWPVSSRASMVTAVPACVDDQTGAFEFRPRSDHGYPAINTEASRLFVAIRDATGVSGAVRKLHVAIAMHADHAGQSRRKTGTRNIAGHYLVNAPRQPRRERSQTILANLFLSYVAGAANSAFLQHTPLEARVPNVEQQGTHSSPPATPASAIEPDTILNRPLRLAMSNAPSSSTPCAVPLTWRPGISTVISRPSSQSCMRQR